MFLENVIEDINYVKNCVKKGKKLALCCIVFDDKTKRIERLYNLTHNMPANILLGEIELWKMDIRDNMVFGKNEIDSYFRIQGDVNE